MEKKGIVVLVLAVILLISCSPRIEKENHLHALAFDPTDPGVIYVATHYFLEKYIDGNGEQIGIYGDDFMGFSIAKDGTFYSSGHSPAIPNVGIRKSTDKGKSWQILRYEGLDFHDLTVSYANPKVIYAWSTPPEDMLVVSKDGGQRWEEVDTDFQQNLFSLAADHQQENELYAGTLLGLFASEDYGKTWKEAKELKNTAIFSIADDPATAGVMYISTHNRGILRTNDGGNSWEEMDSGLPAPQENPLLFLTVNPHNTTEVFGFTKHSEIFKYDGEEWKKIELEQE